MTGAGRGRHSKMNDTKALVVMPPNADEWAIIKEEAGILFKSGLLPNHIKTPEQAIAIMLKGRELSVPAMTALAKIQVIQGTPSVQPELMLALVQRSGLMEDFRIVESNDRLATISVKRVNQDWKQETFTFEQASKMKTKEDGKTIPLTEKYNWRSMPKVMLLWRCWSAILRVVFGDVVSGLYLIEELNPDARYDLDSGEFVQTGEVVSLPDNGNGHNEPAPVAEVQEYADAPVDSSLPMQPARPYAPRHLLTRLTELVQQKLERVGNEATLKESGAKELAIFMKRILPSEEDRHAFLFAAFNVTSSKELTYAEDAAIRAWIGAGAKVTTAKREADDLLASLGPDGKLQDEPAAEGEAAA